MDLANRPIEMEEADGRERYRSLSRVGISAAKTKFSVARGAIFALVTGTHIDFSKKRIRYRFFTISRQYVFFETAIGPSSRTEDNAGGGAGALGFRDTRSAESAQRVSIRIDNC